VDTNVALTPAIICRPLALQHDAGVTCGFRFESGTDWLGQTRALAYAADLGSWSSALADALANVDVLALEFNHDDWLERHSGRPRSLTARIMGDHGHLANHQAAALVDQVLARSAPGRLRHLVQLHLSRQCNRPGLARSATSRILREHDPMIRLHTADQNSPGPWLAAGPLGQRRKPPSARPRLAVQQPWLPGWETSLECPFAADSNTLSL
jgi:hypothetical protein